MRGGGALFLFIFIPILMYADSDYEKFIAVYLIVFFLKGIIQIISEIYVFCCAIV